MALIACPECNRQVSDQAPSCINCGFPLPKKVEPTVLHRLVQAPTAPRDSPLDAMRRGFTDGRRGASNSAPSTSPLPQVTAGSSLPTRVESTAPRESVADAVRAGAAQADYNKNATSLWGFQVLVAAAIAGLASSSWVVFGGVLLVSAILIHVPYLGKLIGFAMAAAFGWGIYELGKHFGASQAGAVIGGIVFLGFLFANGSVKQHGQDLNAGKK